MTTKAEREAATADREWRKTVGLCAETSVRTALERAGLITTEQGGLAVAIAGPDGVTRRYFVRLTEVSQ